MVKTWKENKKLLEEIIEEMVINKTEPQYQQTIRSFYNDKMKDLYKKQYSYQNYTELNKFVLSEINNYVNTIKQNPTHSNNMTGISEITTTPIFNNVTETNYNSNVTREDIHKERDNVFKQRMKEKQQEMDMYNKKPANKIDFTDKTDENNETIDNLLEQELARRNQEIIYNSFEQKKAGEWIHNTTSPNINIHSSNIETSDPLKLKIHNDVDNSKQTIKNKTERKVHFDDNIVSIDSISKPIVSNNLLMKLKQIKSNREIVKIAENNIVHPTNMLTKAPLYSENEIIKKINSLQEDVDIVKTLLYKILSVVSNENENIKLETNDL